jgi:hypothetical protein
MYLSTYAKYIWFLLHLIAGHLPSGKLSESTRKSVVSWITSLAELFPCGVCGHHFKDYLQKNPLYPHTETREQLERYLYDFHDAVNVRTGEGKKTSPPFETVQKAFRGNENWPGLEGYGIPAEKKRETTKPSSEGEKTKQAGAVVNNAKDTYAPAKFKQPVKKVVPARSASRTTTALMFVLLIAVLGGGAVAGYYFLYGRKVKEIGTGSTDAKVAVAQAQ